MAKRCPRCGADGEDDDVFCEADGARLERTGGEPSAPQGVAPSAVATVAVVVAVAGACGGCGAVGTDEGDGYCSSCGHRLQAAPTELPVGSSLGRYTIVSPRASDDAVGRDEAGAEALVTKGTPLALVEAAALRIIQGDPRYPSVIEYVHDDLLALSVPGGRPLAERAPSLDTAGRIAVVDAVIDIAESVERAGFAWSPRAADFHLQDDSKVALARLRGARPLGPNERLDVQLALEALGQLLLASAALDPPALVRVLVTVPLPHHRARTVTEARAHVERLRAAMLAATDEAVPLAALTDMGVRHPHNEDAVEVASGTTGGEPWIVMVVCDGVSSSTHAEQASTIAAKTARDALAHFARSGDSGFEATTTSVSEAIRSAHVAVCASTLDVKSDDPPGSTIVCALIHRKRLTVGWVGDSRAYWITKRGGELLTRDHSWVNETVDRGEMKEEEALRSPLAHALTKCLGPLEDPHGQIKPSVRTRDLAGEGHIVLCSDGVWNYFSTDEIVAIVGAPPVPSAPAVIARRLVSTALARGGHDNATVAIYRHG